MYRWRRLIFRAPLQSLSCFGSCIISLFVDLYPNVMVSSTNPAYNLTVHNTASNPYSLKVMTVVVIVFLPVVLAYQTWTYYVFRRRVSRQEFQPVAARSTRRSRARGGADIPAYRSPGPARELSSAALAKQGQKPPSDEALVQIAEAA